MSSYTSPLNRLLGANVSRWQIAAYAMTNLIGILIIGLGLQFYLDARPGAGGGSDPFGAARYMVVSGVNGGGFAGMADTPSLTEEDIRDIAAQPWASKVIPFSPAGFDIRVGADIGRHGFSTDMFFEGIPEDALDICPDGWDFDPENPSVAIVLPADYLVLYNLGYAPTKGFPQVDEALVKMLPLRITVSGNGRSLTLPGRITGFSKRINTVAVPASFIDWANSRFASGSIPEPRRALIELSEPGNADISRYLAAHGLQESAGGEATSRLCSFVRIVTGVVMGIGLFITLLAAALLIMSVFLLLQKSRDIIADLYSLGYPRGRICRYYYKLTATVNAVILLLAWGATLAAVLLWQPRLRALGLDPSTPVLALAVQLAAALLLTVTGIAVIRRIVGNICVKIN